MIVFVAGENLISERESCSNETTPIITGVIIGIVGVIVGVVVGGSGLIIGFKNKRYIYIYTLFCYCIKYCCVHVYV